MPWGEAWLRLEHRPELLDRGIAVTASEMDAPEQEMRLEVGGVLLEDGIERVLGVVQSSLGEGDLGHPAPGRQGLGGLRGDLAQYPLALGAAPDREVEVRQPELDRRPRRRQAGRRLELSLGVGQSSLPSVEARQGQVYLRGVRLEGQGGLQLALGRGRVALPPVEAGKGQVESGFLVEVRAAGFEATNGGIDLGRGDGRARRHDEGLEVLWILLEDPIGLLPGVLQLSAEQVDGGQLERNLGIVRLQLLGLEHEPERLGDLAELVVRQGQLPNGLGVIPVDAERIAILDHRLAVLLPLEVSVATLEIARLLGLRRARASRGQRQEEGQWNDELAR